MATVSRLGPADHGLPMSLDEFMAGDYAEGFQYELIDGNLYVSPLPDAAQEYVERWLLHKLEAYAAAHPEVINYVTNKARVFIPNRRDVTNPEPDLAVYRDYPHHLPLGQIRWQDQRPFLVGEVLSPDDPEKDLVRNVELYLQVPSIKKYWLLDTRESPDEPSLRAHRRHGQRWRIIDLEYGDTYTTKLLPGFELFIDPKY